MRRVSGAFGPNAMGRGRTVESLSLGLRGNSFTAVVNSGKTNGSALFGTVYKSFLASSNIVVLSKRSVAFVPRRMHTGAVNHLCRSPVEKATPKVAVRRGLTLTTKGNK